MSDLYEQLGRKFGLTPVEIHEIEAAVARDHSLVTQEDFATGMAVIIGKYIEVLGAVPSTFTDPGQQKFAEIVIERAVQLLAGSLESTTVVRS